MTVGFQRSRDYLVPGDHVTVRGDSTLLYRVVETRSTIGLSTGDKKTALIVPTPVSSGAGFDLAEYDQASLQRVPGYPWRIGDRVGFAFPTAEQAGVWTVSSIEWAKDGANQIRVGVRRPARPGLDIDVYRPDVNLVRECCGGRVGSDQCPTCGCFDGGNASYSCGPHGYGPKPADADVRWRATYWINANHAIHRFLDPGLDVQAAAEAALAFKEAREADRVVVQRDKVALTAKDRSGPPTHQVGQTKHAGRMADCTHPTCRRIWGRFMH